MKYLFSVVVVLVSIAAGRATAAPVYVPAGGNLQAAIDRAMPGEQILLQPGATFTGPFTLPRKPRIAGLEVVIRTATSDDQLPPGRRVAPADAPKLAKLVAANGPAVVRVAPAAGGYRLIGLEVAPAPGVELVNVVLLGSWTEDGHWTESRVDELPHDITFDRVFVHGDPVRGSRRGIAMNGRMDATSDVGVAHNTVLSSKGILVADIARPVGARGAMPHTGFVLRDNIVRYGSMGIAGAAAAPGYPTLNQYFYAPVIERNLVIGGDQTMYPPDNFTVAAIDDVEFEDWRRCDFRLSERSLYTWRATDGSGIGATPPVWTPLGCE